MNLADLIAEKYPDWDLYEGSADTLYRQYFIDPEVTCVAVLVYEDHVLITEFERFTARVQAADPQFFFKLQREMAECHKAWKENWDNYYKELDEEMDKVSNNDS